MCLKITSYYNSTSSYLLDQQTNFPARMDCKDVPENFVIHLFLISRTLIYVLDKIHSQGPPVCGFNTNDVLMAESWFYFFSIMLSRKYFLHKQF